MPPEQAVTVLVFTGARISELLDADIDDLPASPRSDVGLTVVFPYAGSGPGVEPRAPGRGGQDRRWWASGCTDFPGPLSPWVCPGWSRELAGPR